MTWQWRDMNWAREVVSPAAGEMLVAATLDNELNNYVTGADLTATGAVAYLPGKHHEGYEAVGAVRLVTTFASFNLQDGFAVGCHFRATPVGDTDFSDADCNDFYELFSVWDGTNLANGYLAVRLEYRNARTNGIEVISNHGTSKTIALDDLEIADAADHSIVVTGKFDTTLGKGKIFLYLDGYLVHSIKLTNANQIFDAATQFEVGNYSNSTLYPAECTISDVFLQSTDIEDPAVVQRYHDEGLNLDCVNDGKVFNPGQRVYGYERRYLQDVFGFDAMDYDPETQRLWGTGILSTTNQILYYANEDGSGKIDAGAGFASTDQITCIKVIGQDIFVAVRDGATPNICTLKKSDKTTISWSDVQTLVDDFYMVNGWSGPIKTPSDMYFAEYGGPTTGGDPANIYRSADGGDTWASSLVLDVPGGTQEHFHGIFYDPYRKYIWACWGDGIGHMGVCYSDDDSADTWADLFTEATTNVVAVFGVLQCTQGYATRHGCVFTADCYNNSASAFWWDANDDHGYDGAGAAMQRWSGLGPFHAPNDPNVYAIYKAKNGTTWFFGPDEDQAGRSTCVYLSDNDGRTMVLAESGMEMYSAAPGGIVETENYIWQGRTRFRNWAKVIPA